MLCFGHITVNASKSAAREKDLKAPDKSSGSSEFINFLSNMYSVYLFSICNYVVSNAIVYRDQLRCLFNYISFRCKGCVPYFLDLSKTQRIAGLVKFISKVTIVVL